MAVISAGKASGNAAGSIKYVEFEKNSTLSRAIYTHGIDCSDYYKDAIQDFQNVAYAYGKTGGRQAHHMVIAFSENEVNSYTQIELMDKTIQMTKSTFPNHQVWLGMHNDTDHLHVHLIINSINLESGLKLQIAGRKGMHEIMEQIQDQCHKLDLDSHLTVGMKTEKQYGDIATNNLKERKLIDQGKSWKADMARSITKSLDTSTSKTEFILKCNEHGIGCEWNDNRQHVTYYLLQAPQKKVRSKNLAKTFSLPQLESKDSMLEQIHENNMQLMEKEITLNKSPELEPISNNILTNNIEPIPINKEKNIPKEVKIEKEHSSNYYYGGISR